MQIGRSKTFMQNICYSSEIYHLDPQDLCVLQDSVYGKEAKCDDEIAILIGDKDYWDKTKPIIYDTLLKGRDAVEKAIAEKTAYVPVRIAFIPKTGKYDFISPLIRVLRYKYKAYSSNIYHINPHEIRDKKIERSFRCEENAYQFSNPKYQMPKEQRDKLYHQLKESMRTNGYDDRFPIDIMLCRNLGIQDTVNQGHHRMSVAIDCNIQRIAIMFSAAGQAPRFLHPLFKVIARFNLWFKQLFQK